MRSPWSLLGLVIVLGGLVGYIYFVDSKTDPNATTREKVWGEEALASADVEEVEIKLSTGEAARVQKNDGTWQIVEPSKAPADETEMSSITSSLTSLEVQRVVDENPANVKQYGLDPARISVSFRSKGRKDPRRIEIGDKTPTGGDLYARIPGQNRVFLLPSYLDSTFNKTPFALRDKAVLKVDRQKADGLELVDGATSIQLAKKGSDWTLVKPLAARADFAVVESSLERVSSAQMVGIVEEEATNLAKYGLDKPSATITVAMGSSRATLLLGRTEEAVVYARDASRPMVFTVPPTLKTDVIKAANEFRRKDLFDARSFTTTHIELKRGSDTITLDKSKDKDGKEVWKNAAGKEVDMEKADDLVTRITGLRASSFESQPHASLKSPALVVTVRTNDNRTETVTFGRTNTDVYASRADEPGAAKIDGTAALDEALKLLDEVK